MAKFNSDDFGLKLYNRFPPSYREDDIGVNYALKRYFQTLGEGFKCIIEEQNGILDLYDPQTCSEEVLYLLQEQYGLELFHGIPTEFIRAFLPNLSTAWSKKGSLDIIDFIVSSLSGVRTETELEYDEEGNVLVKVRLEMDYAVSNYFPEALQFRRILVTNFIPFWCDLAMVFVYFYAELANLMARDYEDTMLIHDLKLDIAGISEDFELLMNNIKNLIYDGCDVIDYESYYARLEVERLFTTGISTICNPKDLLSYSKHNNLLVYRENVLNHVKTAIVHDTGYIQAEDYENIMEAKFYFLNTTKLEATEKHDMVITEIKVHSDEGDTNSAEPYGFITNNAVCNNPDHILSYFRECTAISKVYVPFKLGISKIGSDSSVLSRATNVTGITQRHYL